MTYNEEKKAFNSPVFPEAQDDGSPIERAAVGLEHLALGEGIARSRIDNPLERAHPRTATSHDTQVQPLHHEERVLEKSEANRSGETITTDTPAEIQRDGEGSLHEPTPEQHPVDKDERSSAPAADSPDQPENLHGSTQDTSRKHNHSQPWDATQSRKAHMQELEETLVAVKKEKTEREHDYTNALNAAYDKQEEMEKELQQLKTEKHQLETDLQKANNELDETKQKLEQAQADDGDAAMKEYYDGLEKANKELEQEMEGLRRLSRYEDGMASEMDAEADIGEDVVAEGHA